MKPSAAWCGLLLAACGCGSTTKTAPEKTSQTSVDSASLPDTCQPEVAAGETALIDDFEDGNLLVDSRATFHGLWYVNNDGSGTQSPAADADPTRASLLAQPGSPWSKSRALHTSGSGFTLWGAFVGARLNASRTEACRVDLSAYAGISLSVRGEGALRLNLGTVATTPAEDGGECDSDVCSDYGRVVELSSDWQQVSIAFEQLSQPTWASPADWDPTRALRVSFWADEGDFDFWVDDIDLYR
jgi:hypothetical protein